MKRLNFLLLGVLLLGVFFRFYSLGSIPAGLTNDEADIGYDAYSIMITGRDQWGEFLPVTSFAGFGDYRPALYTYLVVPFVKFFDLNSLAVRLPSAIFGVLSIFAIYALARRIFSEKVGYAAAFLFAISPWSIGLSRVGIESNVAIFFILVSLLLLTKFKESANYLLAGLFFLILTVYTYAAYTLFAFLALFVFAIFYRKDLLKLKQKLIYLFIFVVVLLSPILARNLTAQTRFSQVGLTSNINSIGLIDNLNAERGACLKAYPSIVCRVINNKPVLFAHEFARNYLSHFSPNFIYFTGTDTQYSILYKRGLGYAFGIILVAIGISSIIKSRRKEGYLILSMFLLAPLPDALTGDGNYSRSSIMLPFLIIIEGAGLAILLKSIGSLKNGLLKQGALLFIGLVIIASIVSFYVAYTTYFKNNYSRFSEFGYEELMRNVFYDQKKYDEIYISRNFNDTKHYIYYLFYNKYDPHITQEKKRVKYRKTEDGWFDIYQIDNIHFVPSVSEVLTKDMLSKNILFIAHPSEFAASIKTVRDIHDKVGLIRFREVEMKHLLPYIVPDKNGILHLGK